MPANLSRAAVHCDRCGCDWLDNGLNPTGCSYCKVSALETKHNVYVT